MILSNNKSSYSSFLGTNLHSNGRYLPFLIILLFVTPVFGSSDEWVEYDISKNGNIYSYNKGNIKHRTKNIVQVWIKEVFSDEGREKIIQPMRKGGLPTEEWEKLSHTLVLDEIDCKKRRYQILSVTHYDTDGKGFSIHLYDKPKWDYIVPRSTMNTLRKKVCK